MRKEELSLEELDAVTGGSITYQPNSPGASFGTIGIDGNFNYQYSNYSAVKSYISNHYKDREWSSPSERDQYLISGLLSAGLIS